MLDKCPFCDSGHIQKNGKYKDVQRYKCLDCTRYFCDRSNTIFSSTKLSPSQLRALILLIIDDAKLSLIKDSLHLSSKTVYLWRMKIFKACSELNKQVILKGKVWIDEFLVPVNKKYLVTKDKYKKFRGQSRNQIVVACGVDEWENKYAEIVCKGHITSNECLMTYGKHIEPGSTLIHDGIFSHDKLVQQLHLTSEIHKSVVKSDLKYMQPINSFCAQIERNLTIHIGINNENLQDYLSWIVYKSSLTAKNIEQKIRLLEATCFKNKMIYRVKDRW